MTIKISEVKNIIRLIVDEQKVVFITLWSTAPENGYVVELAYGPKVALIKRNDKLKLQNRFKEIGIKITEIEADHLGWLINRHLRIF